MSSLSSLKPVLTALLLPPVPLIVLILASTRLMLAASGKAGLLSRRTIGFGLTLLCCVGLWLSMTQGFSRTLMTYALAPPAPLEPEDLRRLRLAGARQPGSIAIVVLGGGRNPLAPEYGRSELGPHSMERLRYGVWLSRRTGLPLAFSGGVGWSQRDDGLPEARIAERVAAEEFDRPLRWVEGASRDTRENALYTMEMLRLTGVQRVVLVTHAWHMPRALHLFRDAAGSDLLVEPAPMGYFPERHNFLLEWLPTPEGMQHNRWILRELLGLMVHV